MAEVIQVPLEIQTSPEVSDGALLMNVHLAEYNCLRGEILCLINIEHGCMGFALTGLTGVLALKNNLIQGYEWTVVLAFACLGIIYCDLDSRILRCAHYIDANLRPALTVILGNAPVLEWEAYSRGKLKNLKRRQTLLGGLGATFQGFIFLIPASWFWVIGISNYAVLTLRERVAYGVDAVFIIYLVVGVVAVNLRKLAPAQY